MNAPKLTCRAAPVHKARTKFEDWGLAGPMRKMVAVMCVLALTGCISVTAPDKPIVIELNINITQEVIYRLAADAQNTIEENADIF